MAHSPESYVTINHAGLLQDASGAKFQLCPPAKSKCIAVRIATVCLWTSRSQSSGEMKENVFAFQGSMNFKINWRSTSAMLLEWSWMDTACKIQCNSQNYSLKRAKISSFVYEKELNISLTMHQNVKLGINAESLFSFFCSTMLC